MSEEERTAFLEAKAKKEELERKTNQTNSPQEELKEERPLTGAEEVRVCCRYNGLSLGFCLLRASILTPGLSRLFPRDVSCIVVMVAYCPDAAS